MESGDVSLPLATDWRIGRTDCTITLMRRATFLTVLILSFASVSCSHQSANPIPSMEPTRSTTPAAKPLSESEKIETLIAVVENLKDATFFRNGTDYDCQAAAAHMRRKWKSQQDRIQTARAFIEFLATKSSVSGQPYLIRFKDGGEIPTGSFLMAELMKLEAKGR